MKKSAAKLPVEAMVLIDGKPLFQIKAHVLSFFPHIPRIRSVLLFTTVGIYGNMNLLLLGVVNPNPVEFGIL